MLGRVNLTLTRRAAGTRTNGLWVPGAATTSTIQGSVQPMNGRARERLPEGLRTRQTQTLYTTAQLQPLSITGKQGCDLITTPDGRVHEVDVLSDWSAHAAPTAHREYVLLELGQDEVGGGGGA